MTLFYRIRPSQSTEHPYFDAEALKVSLFADSTQSPTGLTFDAADNLYVSSLGTIKKITPDGSMVSTYVTLPTAFNNNYGLAFDSAGSLYSADAAQSTIFKIAPAVPRSAASGLDPRVPSV